MPPRSGYISAGKYVLDGGLMAVCYKNGIEREWHVLDQNQFYRMVTVRTLDDARIWAAALYAQKRAAEVAAHGGPVRTRDDIVNAVSARHRLSPTDVRGHRRMRPLAYARQEAFYEMRLERRMSYTQIGDYFNRDHTTVMHGIHAFMQRCERAGIPIRPLKISFTPSKDRLRPAEA